MTSVTTTGVTEAIWHFAGYLHLIDEVARSWAVYDDEPPWRPDENLPQTPSAAPVAPPLEPTYSLSSPWWLPTLAPPIEAELLALPGARDSAYRRPDGERDDDTSPSSIPAPRDPLAAFPTFGLQLRAPIERTDAAGETLAQVTQLNRMNDSDIHVWGENLASGLLTVDPAAALDALMSAAREAAPEALIAPQGHEAVVEVLAARHAALAAGDGDGTLDAHAVDGPGKFVDGERVADDWTLPDLETRAGMPEGRNGHEAVGAHAELGANEATNFAVVQDLNELSLQTIVFGDYYRLDAIVQINAIMNVDSVLTFGAQGSSLAAGLAGAAWDGGGGDRLTNVAEFLDEDVDLGALERPGFGGLRWKVDVLEGDFWDVKALYQTNLLVDNDLYSKTEYGFFSQVRMGENLSLNLAEFLQFTGNYDLIVVGGNAYSANWIVQMNALLDSDGVVVGHMGGAGAQTISTGQNQLTNEALIAHYGGGGFTALDDDLGAFVGRLLTDDSLDPAEWWALNGIGSADMKVLYVTGDYHDVNLVHQLNIVADADQAAQILPAFAAHGEEGAEQWIATGGNRLTNVAAIADTQAAVATHVGGEVYEEDFLVQAEIVIDDDGSDEFGLAPELVAFTGGPELQQDDDEVFGGAPLAGDGDAMGSMLT
ncbi:hypothetical protein [Salinarimonas sp.]|uniref:hypothetical protein n=1 Tax=Salinarimonas sp. TaxID=2766526 RepID=UPI0032D90D53